LKYCSDTWFLIKLYEKEEKAIEIIKEIRFGKGRLIIPAVVYTETGRKLMKRGVSLKDINAFFENLFNSNKIEFIVIDKSISDEVIKLCNSFNIAIMDSFIAASYKLFDCDFLLSGDSDYDLLVKHKYLKRKSW